MGVYHICTMCADNFCLCFKCYRSSTIIHPGGHILYDYGSEYITRTAEHDSNDGDIYSEASSAQIEEDEDDGDEYDGDEYDEDEYDGEGDVNENEGNEVGESSENGDEN